MLGHNEQIDDREGFQIVVHEQQVRIIAGGQTLALRLECTIDNSRAEFTLLAFELKFFATGRAEEISERAIVWERGNSCVATMWAIRPSANPGFSPCAGALRAAGIGGLGGFFEAQFHNDSVAKFVGISSVCNAITSSIHPDALARRRRIVQVEE